MRKHRSGAARFLILAKGGYRCAVTGEDIDPSADGFHVDHRVPLGLGGGEEDDNLQALAIAAHKLKTIADLKAIAKMKRIKLKHAGLWVSKHPLPCGRKSKWKRKVSGEVVRKGTT
jgi:5-methylcytosine-specific restriction enzyme A